MSDISKILGKRIRSYRAQAGLSQEKLAEAAGCHHTYIGQLERGEKNATVESIERVATALNIPLSKLFEKLGDYDSEDESIPLACYELISGKTKDEQAKLYKILLEIEKYKSLA